MASVVVTRHVSTILLVVVVPSIRLSLLGLLVGLLVEVVVAPLHIFLSLGLVFPVARLAVVAVILVSVFVVLDDVFQVCLHLNSVLSVVLSASGDRVFVAAVSRTETEDGVGVDDHGISSFLGLLFVEGLDGGATRVLEGTVGHVEVGFDPVAASPVLSIFVLPVVAVPVGSLFHSLLANVGTFLGVELTLGHVLLVVVVVLVLAVLGLLPVVLPVVLIVLVELTSTGHKLLLQGSLVQLRRALRLASWRFSKFRIAMHGSHE